MEKENDFIVLGDELIIRVSDIKVIEKAIIEDEEQFDLWVVTKDARTHSIVLDSKELVNAEFKRIVEQLTK